MNNKRQFVKGRNCLYAIFFLLFFSLRLLAVEAVDKKISVSFSNLPLKEAIHEIEVASGYTFFYDGNKIDLISKGKFERLESAYRVCLKFNAKDHGPLF